MQEPVNNNRSELWTLSLRDLFYKYVRFLPVFLLSVSLCLFVAYAYLRYATRIYSAGGTLLIKNDQDAPGRSDKFEDLFMNTKSLNIASEIEILKSRPLMERVVNKLNLQTSYIAHGRFVTNNIYKQGPFLMEALQLNDSFTTFSINVKVLNDSQFRVDNVSTVFNFGNYFKNTYGVFRLVRMPGLAGKDYTITWRPASSIASELAAGIVVTPKTLGTGILSISTQGTNPQMCADIVNQLMKEYIDYSIESKNLTSEQILQFIDVQLIIFGRQLDSIQKVLLDYQQKYHLFDLDAQTSDYVSRMADADKDVNEQQVRMNMADLIDNYISDKKNAHSRLDLVPSSLGLEDPTLNALVEQYNTAQLKRKEYVDANVSEQNPLLKELDGSIDKLRGSIIESLNVIKSAISSTLGDLRKTSSGIEAEIKDFPVRAKELLEIKRQVEAVQNLYKILQEKRVETSISKASTIPNSQVIDKATISLTPIKPNKKTFRILAILLGLGLPAMFIFISEVLNDKISTRFDIEKITPAPILGEIGHSYSHGALIVTKTTRSMVAEQFRIIRSNLQYILNRADKSVILITSSFSGEGKSFVTTNMGAVLALAGKRTIILEFDIRKPKILSGLNMPKRPGITNFLVGKATLNELIVAVPGQDNFFILPCGPIPPNPSELLLDDKVADLFSQLRQQFDIILIDTAPVGMVSDAQTLSKFADCTLYLVRQGHTFKKQVALIDEFYQENKLPKVSVVINDVKVKPGYGYYGYGRYGYGYGYGFDYGGYYEEERPPMSLLEKVLHWIDIRRLFNKSRKDES